MQFENLTDAWVYMQRGNTVYKVAPRGFIELKTSDLYALAATHGLVPSEVPGPEPAPEPELEPAPESGGQLDLLESEHAPDLVQALMGILRDENPEDFTVHGKPSTAAVRHRMARDVTAAEITAAYRYLRETLPDA